jgi:hypothetical protein
MISRGKANNMMIVSAGATVPTTTPQPEKLAPMEKGAIPIRIKVNKANARRIGPIYLINFIVLS